MAVEERSEPPICNYCGVCCWAAEAAARTSLEEPVDEVEPHFGTAERAGP